MDEYSKPVVDRHGSVMFYCSACGAPISSSDILDFGTRLPDFGETAQDYLDAQLIDSFRHQRCLNAAKAS